MCFGAFWGSPTCPLTLVNSFVLVFGMFDRGNRPKRVVAHVFEAAAFKRQRVSAPELPPNGARLGGTAHSTSGRFDDEELACTWPHCSFVAENYDALQAHEWDCSRNWTQTRNPLSTQAKEESRQLARAEALRKQIAELERESAEAAEIRAQLALIEATVNTLSAELDAAGQVQISGTSEKRAQPKAAAAKKTTDQPGQEASRQQPSRPGKGPSQPAHSEIANKGASHVHRGDHPRWTVHEFAKILGMELEDVLGDGNCLFLAWMRRMGFITQAEACPCGGVLSPAIAEKVLQLRRAAVAHVEEHFLAAEKPQAGPYGRIIANSLYTLDMSGDRSVEELMEMLKRQVRTGMAKLANLGTWRLEDNRYVFNFMVCAVACLGETPILCVESHSREDDEVLYKHFQVFGDPKHPALKAFSHLAQAERPYLRDFDFTNGRCEGHAEQRRVDVSGLVILYNMHAVHYQCFIPPAHAQDPAGDESAMRAPSRSVDAVRATPPPVLRVASTSSTSRSCEVGPLGAASPSTTAASAPATHPEPRKTSSATGNCKSGTTTDVQRLAWLKRFTARLLPEVDLQAVDIDRFGPSVSACMQHLYDGDAAAATSTRPKR